MSKFFALDMAHEVSKHPQIKSTSGIFGHFKTVIYVPTESKMESYSNYYKESDARLLKNLIECPDEEIEQKISALSETDSINEANFRLDLCISQDAQFVAMQLNHVADGVITHITPIRYFVGQMAQRVEEIF